MLVLVCEGGGLKPAGNRDTRIVGKVMLHDLAPSLRRTQRCRLAQIQGREAWAAGRGSSWAGVGQSVPGRG
jgi:3-dehydroquinate dehydratase